MPNFIINFAKEAPYEAGMAIFTYLAYPDKVGNSEDMASILASLCNTYLRHKANEDAHWSGNAQSMKPLYALRSENEVKKDLKIFDRLLRDRLVAAKMAIAFLQEVGSEHPPALPKGISKLSLNQLSGMGQEELGQTEAHNIEARIWRPSIPVVHLAAALAVVMDQLEKSTKSIIGIFEIVENPRTVKLIVDYSNEYADLLIKSTKVNIVSEELIRLELIT